VAIITFEIRGGVITSYDKKLPKAQLRFQADGLDVYVLGSLSDDNNYERVTNLAMSVCVERHIPIITLHRVKVDKSW
jgi:hypothetical protein